KQTQRRVTRLTQQTSNLPRRMIVVRYEPGPLRVRRPPADSAQPTLRAPHAGVILQRDPVPPPVPGITRSTTRGRPGTLPTPLSRRTSPANPSVAPELP